MEEALSLGNIKDSIETSAFKAINACFGGGMVLIRSKDVIKHLVPDGQGGMKLAAHPNKLKAMLGFHDTRTIRNKVVTTAFCNDIVDCLTANATQLAKFDDYKYHDFGTGTGNEAAGDTTLGTPCGEARSTGTQVEGASAYIYKTVATHTFAGSFAITEHGIFNESTGGVLMDRTKFSAVNMTTGEGIESTYQITFTAGS